MQSTRPHVFQWMLDTRPLWPTPDILSPKEGMIIFKTSAIESLSLLPVEEQQAVLKFYHPRDARMSLGSHLLKRFAISKLLDIPWPDAKISRSLNGKPIYAPPSSTTLTALDGGIKQRSIEFNVSHQAGVVTLVACSPPKPPINDLDLARPNPYSPDWKTPSGEIDLGTDIVCPNERHDLSRIAREGFFAFVDTFADVLALSETQALKMDSSSQLCLFPADVEDQVTARTRDAISRCQYPGQDVQLAITEGGGLIKGTTIIEAKLRRFFALWCLREAWVKMTGEALLADWLKDLEFREYKVPRAVPATAPVMAIDKGPPKISVSKEGASRRDGGLLGQGHGDVWSEDLESGEVVTEKEMQIWFKRKRVTDVKVELRAIGKNYMVATAVRRRPMPGSESVAVKSGTTRDQTKYGNGNDLVLGVWEPLRLEDVHAIARRHQTRGALRG